MGVGDGQLCKDIALLILFLKIVLYVTISASVRIKFVYCSSYEKPCHICTDANQHHLNVSEFLGSVTSGKHTGSECLSYKSNVSILAN